MKIKIKGVLFILLVDLIYCQQTNFTALLITQQWDYELKHAEIFEDNFIEGLKDSGINPLILKTHKDFERYIGAWGIWSILRRLLEQSRNSEWILIAEPFTTVNWQKLLLMTNDLNSNDNHFFGRALHDEEPSIIHHYYGFQGSEKRLYYPDFAAGILLSRGALIKIAGSASNHEKSDFTIDAKHEFSKFVYDSTDIELTNVPEFCLLPEESNCITKYVEPKYSIDESGCGQGIEKENVFYAVKTFSGYHKSRVVYVKRTWARKTKFIEFFSDIEDRNLPSIDLGVNNTEKGHCQKTIEILKYFIKNEEFKHINWLVVADDDTLFNVYQLHKVINCLPTSTRLILGERYAYGFESDGFGGYDYPTGGSGFVMSRAAVGSLAYSCDCPKVDSPDDMIIGMCARRLNIPILHSAAFHQTQRLHYDPLYIKRIKPISFHKFEDIDPYTEYTDYLLINKKESHTEL